MIAQYASDLHLEFPENKKFIQRNPIQPKADILLLAGDIVPFAIMDKHADFFDYVSDHFAETYWIPGNHEYYYYDLATKCGVLNEKIRDNVFLVNNTAISRNNLRFIFSTLWSKISPVHQWQIERTISDFQVIKYNKDRFSYQHFNQLHDESMVFLKQELSKHQDAKSVVVTHHVPTFLHYPERYKNDPLNEAFTVELHDFIEEKGSDYWIYGHHHNNTPNFQIGKTALLTNQLGYVKANEHHNFSQNSIINL